VRPSAPPTRQPHSIDQPRVERRAGDAGYRHHEKRIDVGGGKPGVVQRAIDRAFAQFLRHLEPSLVGLAPGRKSRITLQWECQMAVINPNPRMEAGKQLRLFQPPLPVSLHSCRNRALRIVEFRHCAGHADDLHELASLQLPETR
jgi:hypothetical protein